MPVICKQTSKEMTAVNIMYKKQVPEETVSQLMPYEIFLPHTRSE
jgi:hypothetical protein